MAARIFAHNTARTQPVQLGEVLFVREDGIVAYPGRELEVGQVADVVLFSNTRSPLDSIVRFWTRLELRKGSDPGMEFGHAEVIIDQDPIGDPTSQSAEVFGLVSRRTARLLGPGTRGEIWRHELAATTLTRDFVLRTAVHRAAAHPGGYAFIGAARSAGPIDWALDHIPIADRLLQENREAIFCSFDVAEEARAWGPAFDILPGVDIKENPPSSSELSQGLTAHPQWHRVAYWLPREVR